MRPVPPFLFALALIPGTAIAQDHQHGTRPQTESETAAPAQTSATPSAGADAMAGVDDDGFKNLLFLGRFGIREKNGGGGNQQKCQQRFFKHIRFCLAV